MLKKDFDDLFANGEIGDWCFTSNHDGVEDTYIFLIFPDTASRAGKDFIMLPVKPDVHLPSGHAVWQWDGNKEAPTLAPSIGVGKPPYRWHGYLEHGVLRTV